MGWTTKSGAKKHRTALLKAARTLERKADKTNSKRVKRMYLQQADARKAIAKSIKHL